MKVLYVSSMRDFFSGAKKQLKWEIESSQDLKIDWNIVVIHDGKIENSMHEVNPPKIFRNLLFRNLYTWIYIIKNQKNYDIVINRHITFDIFVILFGWFVKNRFSVHHGKEVEGLRVVRKNWKGKVASLVEKITGFISLKQVRGAICVTNDIAEYQNKRAGVKTFLYPNGINTEIVSLLNDCRIDSEVNIAFVCSIFSEWHGLDLLLDNIKQNEDFIKNNNIKFHLIGNILKKDLISIANINNINNIVTYGHLTEDDYNKVLEKCDIGLDSLALFREGLKEGSALKVREYLAYGLPVYSGFQDSAIPPKFEYYKVGEVDVKEMYTFAVNLKKISREKIRISSIDFISKTGLLNKLYTDINNYKQLIKR